MLPNFDSFEKPKANAAGTVLTGIVVCGIIAGIAYTVIDYKRKKTFWFNRAIGYLKDAQEMRKLQADYQEMVYRPMYQYEEY